MREDFASFAAKLFDSLGKAYAKEAPKSEGGLKPRDARLILAVSRYPGKRQSFYARTLGMHRSNLAVDIQRLVDCGYLLKMPLGAPPSNGIDRRPTVIVLGPKRVSARRSYLAAWAGVLDNRSPVIQSFVAMMEECGVPEDGG